MVVLSFIEFSVYGENYLKILDAKFSPLLHLHYYYQVASIFMFISDSSVKLLLLKRLRLRILKKLTQRHNQGEEADLDDCDKETCTSTQFLQLPKNQLIDLQDPSER